MTAYHDERIPFPTPRRLVRELRLKRPPWWLTLLLCFVVIATWIPLAFIYKARREVSRVPRVHFFHDMDHQAKFGPQEAHPWFLDGRAMRLPIEGTISRGSLAQSQSFRLGYLTVDGASESPASSFAVDLPEEIASELPALLLRGNNRFQIYCAPCHGSSGQGDGPIHVRATELKESKWVPATNLMTKMVRDRINGQLYQAITDGIRNMPSYGSQISMRDRWAIIAYLRKLQSELPIAPEKSIPVPTSTDDQNPLQPSGVPLVRSVYKL